MKRNTQFNLIFILTILLAVVLGCSDGGGDSDAKTPETKIPPAYIGTWTGADGSSLTIRNDGSGDYKSGGNSMSGGSVEVDEAAKEIRFSLLLFDKKYKIDEPPKSNRMKLDGMEYRRTGGFSTEEKTDSDTENSADAPTDAELNQLAGETIRSFDRAIQQNDFSEFAAIVSERLRAKYSAEDFARAFADKIKQKNKYQLKADAPLTFESQPILKNEGNTFEIKGTYPTTISGRNIPFELTYVRENDEWKLLGIFLNPDSPPNDKK